MEHTKKSHCEHLDNYSGELDSCPCKRYLVAVNPMNNRPQKFIFCNEWFRLNIQEKCSANQYYAMHKFAAIDLVRDMICNHFEITEYERFNFNSKAMKVGLVLCERPFIHIHVSIRTAVEWYKIQHSRDLIFSIQDSVLDWCNRNERYKKHKSNCATIKALLNKLRHLYSPEEKEILLNELFLIILKITANETH